MHRPVTTQVQSNSFPAAQRSPDSSGNHPSWNSQWNRFLSFHPIPLDTNACNAIITRFVHRNGQVPARRWIFMWIKSACFPSQIPRQICSTMPRSDSILKFHRLYPIPHPCRILDIHKQCYASSTFKPLVMAFFFLLFGRSLPEKVPMPRTLQQNPLYR